MIPGRWMEVVLGTQSKVALLRLMARDPHRGWTIRELAHAARLSPNTAQRALAQLRDAGILDYEVLGHTHRVALRADSVLTKRIQLLFENERALAEEAWQAVRDATPAGTATILFGSLARDEARGESDVDLLVVGPDAAQAEATAQRIGAAVGGILPLRLSIISLGRAQWRRRRSAPWARRALKAGRTLSRTHLGEVA